MSSDASAGGLDVVLIGASTLLGQEVRRQLAQRRFPLRVLSMMGEGSEVGQIVEYDGEARLVTDLDLERRRVRIEQSKGLKDRIVCLSEATLRALEAWVEVRGPAGSDHVFIYRHLPLSVTYCATRLRTYGKRCGVVVTPHQLRHSCATLLLNAGAPILTVQAILGHKHVDTTLRYARLYDATVSSDYYRAMEDIERRMALQEETQARLPTGGELLVLMDTLQDETLNEDQRETVQALRAAILAWDEESLSQRPVVLS